MFKCIYSLKLDRWEKSLKGRLGWESLAQRLSGTPQDYQWTSIDGEKQSLGGGGWTNTENCWILFNYQDISCHPTKIAIPLSYMPSACTPHCSGGFPTNIWWMNEWVREWEPRKCVEVLTRPRQERLEDHTWYLFPVPINHCSVSFKERVLEENGL